MRRDIQAAQYVAGRMLDYIGPSLRPIKPPKRSLWDRFKRWVRGLFS